MFIFPTYICLTVQDNLFTISLLSNVFPTLLTESLLLLNLPVAAKKLYRVAHIFSQKVIPYLQIFFVCAPKYFTIMPKQITFQLKISALCCRNDSWEIGVCKTPKRSWSYENIHCLVKLQVHRTELYLLVQIFKNLLDPTSQNS